MYSRPYSADVKSQANGCIPMLRMNTDKITEIISHTNKAPDKPARPYNTPP
jgi:hypothetical protein